MNAAGVVVAIFNTSSSGSPVNLTVSPIARSIDSAEPARCDAPAHARGRHAARGVQLDPQSAERIDAGRTARRRDRVGDEHAARRRLRAHHRLDRGGRQMMAVDDEAREQFVVRELLPDDVRMARERRRAAVAEMRRQRRASFHGGVNVIRRGGGVTERHTNPARDEMLDQRDRARHFRRQRDEHDPPVGCLLTPREIVDGRGDAMLARMRAAKAVERRDIRALHVNARDRAVGIWMTHDDARARREVIQRRRDDRRQAARHAGRAHRIERARHAIGRAGRWIVEVDAGEAVHLQVDESGHAHQEQPSPCPSPSGEGILYFAPRQALRALQTCHAS